MAFWHSSRISASTEEVNSCGMMSYKSHCRGTLTLTFRAFGVNSTWGRVVSLFAAKQPTCFGAASLLGSETATVPGWPTCHAAGPEPAGNFSGAKLPSQQEAQDP